MSNALFKIGDKVRRRKDCQCDPLWHLGDAIFEIEKISIYDLKLKGQTQWFQIRRFELVAAAEPDFITQLRLAKSYMGKKVFYTGQDPFVVDKVFVADKPEDTFSGIVNDYIRANEFCVVVQGKRGSYGSKVLFPVVNVQLAPEFIKIDVGGVDVKIYDNKVIFGCYNLTHDEIKNLAKLLP